MKNIKNFNPIVLARNALAASGLMTLLNIIVVALHFAPIFPLSLLLPIVSANFALNTNDQLIAYFGTLEKLNQGRPFFIFVTLILLFPLVYSYFRSAKKPSAIKIGFGVIVLDIVYLMLKFSLTFSFIIDMIYHAALLYYVFKGILALKAAKNV